MIFHQIIVYKIDRGNLFHVFQNEWTLRRDPPPHPCCPPLFSRQWMIPTFFLKPDVQSVFDFFSRFFCLTIPFWQYCQLKLIYEDLWPMGVGKQRSQSKISFLSTSTENEVNPFCSFLFLLEWIGTRIETWLDKNIL